MSLHVSVSYPKPSIPFGVRFEQPAEQSLHKVEGNEALCLARFANKEECMGCIITNPPKNRGPDAPKSAQHNICTLLKRLASFHRASQIAPRFRVGVLHSYLRTARESNPAGDGFLGASKRAVHGDEWALFCSCRPKWFVNGPNRQ